MNRRSFARMIGAAALAAVPGLPARAAPVVIKFSHVVAPDTPKGKAAQRFKDLAEQYTGGAVRVEIHPNSQLYKDKDELEALQLGAVEMLAPSLAKFAPLGLPEFELFDLPFLMNGHDDLRRITDGAVGRDLLARLDTRGITGLAYWDNGFKIMSANVPLRLPGDFRGLKMRIQASKVLEAQMQALGAVPQVMVFSEAYQALQLGVVDGTENPPSNMYTQKMHQVQTQATLSDHGFLGYAVIVNRAFWASLPDALRDDLDRALAEATVYGNSIARAENDRALAAMQAAGTTAFHRLTADERAAWVAALHPVHAAMADRIGPDLLAQVHDLVGIGG